MKIGILTFHWATNYGAVLQCYALQTYLESIGHEVNIINYKPRHFDDTWWSFIKYRKFLQYDRYKNGQHKEKQINLFREKYLKQTRRVYNCEGISEIAKDYDTIISGSDQVLNPSFLFNGEGRRVQSPAYFLEFPYSGRKVGYAVSFGCTKYPTIETKYARSLIPNFDVIGVRESTGLDILKQLDYSKDSAVVPDPTILCYNTLFDNISIERKKDRDYICAYILHKEIKVESNDVIYIDEKNNPLTIEAWISTIANSKGLITNSYHGMIMAILNNVPFVAIILASGSIGMNDRFYTLLTRLGLEDRICCEGDNYLTKLTKTIDWNKVSDKIRLFSEFGKEFIYNNIK